MAMRPHQLMILAAACGVLALACTAPRAEAYVYWTSGDDGATVGRANLDGTGKIRKFVSAGHPTFGLAVDGAHIYWATSGGNVGRANLDGTGADQHFIPDVNPYGIAVDASHIYWPRFNTSIGRANLDGTGADVNFIAGDEDLGTENMAPSEVAVAGPYIYWIDQDTGIGRANLDGSSVILRLVRTGADLSHVLAVDGAHIYWDDEIKNTIGRANLDGSGVNTHFITGARDVMGLAISNGHIYWSSNIGDSIGRANLDGTGVNQKFITNVFATTIAVDALGPQPGPTPPPHPKEPKAGKHGLKSNIFLDFRGARVKGYRVSLDGLVGSRHSAADNIAVQLSKRTGNRRLQTHRWSVQLDRADVTLDRNKASIVVNHPLGPGGARGLLAFTIRGKPKRATFACHQRANRVTGLLKGTIRINVGDEYFKTITVTKLRGTATGTATAPHCRRPPCAAQSWLTANTLARTAPGLGVDASTRRVNGRRLSNLTLGVFEPTTDTPFDQVAHILVLADSPRRLFSTTPTLRSATIRAPGGAMSGALRFKPTAKLKRRAFSNCRHGILSRPARVTGGAITATYDSIGKRVFDTNLNSGGGAPPMLNRTS